jgi:hypothetical protein
MNLHDYQSLQPRDIPDEDVFVCTSFYMPESKSIAQRKAETTTVTSSPLEPLTRKRSFVKAHCTGEPVLPEIAATLPSTVQFGKGVCKAVKYLILLVIGSRVLLCATAETVPLVFVCDSDIPLHIQDTDAVSGLFEQLYARIRGQTSTTKTSKAKTVATPSTAPPTRDLTKYELCVS